MNEYTADTGTTIPPEVDAADHTEQPLDMVAEAFAHIPLKCLVASLTNPRTTFNAAKLQELVDSIKASGVHQPILVRPLPGSRVYDTDRYVLYEIVAGERRFRACQLAGLSTIPAMVRPMADGDVLEVQIIENLQRDDLSELEEAEGYERLMQHSELNADQVGAKIGKSRSYVYARLKLLDLSLECKTALREGTIDASRALLIARIPDSKLQIKALEYATGRYDNGGQGEPPSVRMMQVWLQQNVMLPLERAPFVITDARLVQAAGSCKDCPKRTGANPDIFADVASADICTDPPCYNHKAEAHQLRNMARAEAKGMRLIRGPEAKTICYEKSSALKGYSPLSQVREDAGGERLDNLLGKDFAGAVLIENPWTHELIEAVPTAEAEGVLLARGLVTAVVEPKAKADRAEMEIDLLKKGIDRKIEKSFREAAYSAIAGSIRSTPDVLASSLITPQLLRAWFINEVENMPTKSFYEPLQMTFENPLLESQCEEAVQLRIRAADSATLFKAVALYMIGDDCHVPFGVVQGKNHAHPTHLFTAAAADKCIDLADVRARVTKDVKADITAQIAALKAQNAPQKPPAPTAPLAQPVLAPVAGAKSPLARPKSAHVPAPKLRLSAQEAKQGIAEAMQGIEAEPDGAEAAPLDQATPVLKSGPQANSQGALAVGFAIGQRVRVLPNVSIRHSKWIGKEGTITAKMGDAAWDVTFKGRNGGLASFDVSELEVVGS